MNEREKSASIPDGTPHLPEQTRLRESGTFHPEVFAERLRAARRAAQLTQQELAGGRFSKSYISAIERGKLFPSFRALSALAETLAVPISYLLGESEIDGQALEDSTGVVSAAAAHEQPIEEEEARRRLGQAEVYIHQDRSEAAWEELGERDEPPAGWPLLLRPHWVWLAGWTLYLLGKPDEAVSCLELGVRLAGALRLRAPRGRQAYWDEMIEWLHCFLGVAHCAQGNTRRSLEYYQRGLEAIKQGRARNAELQLFIYKGLGNEYFAQARYQQAVGYYQQALEQVRNCDNQRQHGLAAWGLARAYQQQQDVLRAKRYYRQALEVLGAHGNRQLLAQIRALYGLALIELEDYAEAERQLQKSLDGARGVGDLGTCGMALAYTASLALARGDPDQAIAAAQASLPLVRHSGDVRAEGHALFKLAAAYTARNDRAAAEQAYREAIGLAEQVHDDEMLVQARQGYAEFLAAQERFQEAYQELALVSAGAQEPAKV